MFPNLTKESTIAYKNVIVPTLNEDGSNAVDFFVADLKGSRKFAQNSGGYPRSDIALINEQTDMKVAQALLDDLVDYSSDFNPNEGLSDDEILYNLQPKACQTPSERVRYIEHRLQYIEQKKADALAAKQADALAAKQAGENTIKFDDPDVKE